jgi:hypothetical protein
MTKSIMDSIETWHDDRWLAVSIRERKRREAFHAVGVTLCLTVAEVCWIALIAGVL